MTSQYVKTLTGFENEPNAQLDAIYGAVSRQLLHRLRHIERPDKTVIPPQLEHVIDEITIARFNYIGSEGMKAETVEGHAATYAAVSFYDFEADIAAYIDEMTEDSDTPAPQKGVVRFI